MFYFRKRVMNRNHWTSSIAKGAHSICEFLIILAVQTPALAQHTASANSFRLTPTYDHGRTGSDDSKGFSWSGVVDAGKIRQFADLIRQITPILGFVSDQESELQVVADDLTLEADSPCTPGRTAPPVAGRRTQASAGGWTECGREIGHLDGR